MMPRWLQNTGIIRRRRYRFREFYYADLRFRLRSAFLLYGKNMSLKQKNFGRIAGSAPAERGHWRGEEDAAMGSPPQAAYPAMPDTFLMIQEIPPDFLYHKKPSGRDRTAAERKYIAKAIRRRRGILQSRILFYIGKIIL